MTLNSLEVTKCCKNYFILFFVFLSSECSNFYVFLFLGLLLDEPAMVLQYSYNRHKTNREESGDDSESPLIINRVCHIPHKKCPFTERKVSV
jgi:hypothetical protein